MMNLQRISDERLIIKNMKNIRLTYALQTLGIVGLLGYDFITDGINSIKGTPLWIVFIASTVVLAFLSLNSDERQAFKNLQMIRIAYAVQVLGIVGIEGYDFATKGWNGVQDNPLGIVFIVSATVLAFLSMNTSVDYENNKNPARKGLVISIVALLLISATTGIFTSFSEGFTAIDGILAGGILFICGVVPFVFLYGLRKNKKE